MKTRPKRWLRAAIAVKVSAADGATEKYLVPSFDIAVGGLWGAD